jgi:copper oxidase (laccase) domain-containing protein
MVARYGAAADRFIEKRGEKYHLDLKGINALSLQQVGVKNISISNLCTACAPDRFWSHRKVGNLRGSQAGIIVCKEGHL